MKKVLFFIFLFISILFSASSESKIISLIFNSLFKGKEILIYTNSKEKQKIITEAGFIYTYSCKEASIAYISDYSEECKNKPFFTDNYRSFKENPNAIGAFYWKKGRPNILFLKPRLKSFNLKLPNQLVKYQLEEL